MSLFAALCCRDSPKDEPTGPYIRVAHRNHRDSDDEREARSYPRRKARMPVFVGRGVDSPPPPYSDSLLDRGDRKERKGEDDRLPLLIDVDEKDGCTDIAEQIPSPGSSVVSIPSTVAQTVMSSEYTGRSVGTNTDTERTRVAGSQNGGSRPPSYFSDGQATLRSSLASSLEDEHIHPVLRQDWLQSLQRRADEKHEWD